MVKRSNFFFVLLCNETPTAFNSSQSLWLLAALAAEECPAAVLVVLMNQPAGFVALRLFTKSCVQFACSNSDKTY